MSNAFLQTPINRLIVIAPNFIEMMHGNLLTGDLYLTSIGYVAHTPCHFIHDSQGIADYMLLYCRIGKGYVEVGKAKHRLMPNQYIILPPHVRYRYYADAQDPWSLYWIQFSGAKAIHFAHVLLVPTAATVEANSHFEERTLLFEEIYNALDRGIDLSTLNYVNACLFYYLNSLLYIEHMQSVPRIFVQNDSCVNLAKQFMNRHIEENLTVSELAAYVGYSPSCFYRKFVKESGVAPIQYFIQLKMNTAATMLIKTNLSIAQIAQKVGYQDYFYFLRVFKKCFAITADKFRKQNFRL